MIREAIVKLVNKENLTYEMAEGAMDEIMGGKADPIQISAFLTAMTMKGETIEEITACANGMRKHGVHMEHDKDVLEIVGTGGDKSNSFNISTTASLVISAGGVAVAKHGNRAASSKSGAADCLEALGVKIDLEPEKNKEVLEKLGICFLFAQKYHMSMKYVAPVRKMLGIRTIFNILGPLTNPAAATMQVMGVYEEALVRPMAEVLSNLGVKRGMVVYGQDCLDEISLSAPTSVCEIKDGTFEEYVITPEEFGMTRCTKEELALAVGWPVLRDGLQGLKGRPSADTMPALAACGAALEAAIALLNARSYQTSSWTLLSGIAALGLFMALLGSRVQLAAVKNGYDLATKDPAGLQGAFRVKDKDLIRMLARSLDEKDPWVLLSRPVQWDDALLEQSFGERTSERRARKTSYILLGAAVLSGLAFLLFGGGLNGMAAAMTAMLCMGAPLSSTLVAGLATLRLQKSAAAAGAVIPGWAAIEELGGVDTVQVDADELFTADSVNLEDIRIFKGGRIDRAILYAASVLNESHGTLKGLFRQIVEERTDILFPVKDLEQHHGLGFSAWCDNNRILIGTRRYLEQEGVPLPDEEYEMQHSKNGELQILYLAVSGNLHAMFVLKYVGGRNVARSLAVLQKENIRLLVTCQDPSLTAHHITEAYRLPEGMITVLDQEQCNAIKAAPADPEDTCCMIHLKAFASLTGGLQAADQAQNAESSATTVQMVSVLFSIIIAALLTSAGSIWELSVATVLMYQAAWSALSIAVCALKQHN